MSGITCSYIIGRTVGWKFLHSRFGKLLHITDERIRRIHDWFDRIGHWALLIGYFVAGVRHFTAIVAGTSKLEYRSFALFAYSGAIAWVSTFLFLGYHFGKRWEEILGLVEHHLKLLVGNCRRADRGLHFDSLLVFAAKKDPLQLNDSSHPLLAPPLTEVRYRRRFRPAWSACSTPLICRRCILKAGAFLAAMTTRVAPPSAKEQSNQGRNRVATAVADRFYSSTVGKKAVDGGKRLHTLSLRHRALDRQSSDLRRAREAQSLRGVSALAAGVAVDGAHRAAGDGAAAHLVVCATGVAQPGGAAGWLRQEEGHANRLTPREPCTGAGPSSWRS